MPGDVCRVLFVGQLVARKGIREFIDALSLALAEAPFDVTIAGRGPMRAELEQMLRDRQLEARVPLVGMCLRLRFSPVRHASCAGFPFTR